MDNTISIETYSALLQEIKACRFCEQHLPLGPNPILRFHPESRLLIVGQAPGTAVHRTGIPWNDPSGKRLRQWMRISDEDFYDVHKVAIVPMGFCYPGKGKGGDLPPRPECATLWREKIHQNLPNIEFTLLIGRYAIDYYLPEYKGKSLETILQDAEQLIERKYLPMVHPSPRNIRWFMKNPWFEMDIVPMVGAKVGEILRLF